MNDFKFDGDWILPCESFGDINYLLPTWNFIPTEPSKTLLIV